jgi:hypothetical protein
MSAFAVTSDGLCGVPVGAWHENGPEGGAEEVSDRVDVVTESNGFDPEVLVFGVLLQGSLPERILRENRYSHSESSEP